MAIWQMLILIALAGGIMVCLIKIGLAVENLARAISPIGAEIKRMNSKLESVEAVGKENDQKPAVQDKPDFDAIEAAISNFEKLKRIDTA